jgi:hypothetical protein
VIYIREVSLLVVAMTIVSSALHHLAKWRDFRADIAAQRLLPPSAVAAAVTLVELVLGGGLCLIAVGVVDGDALRRTGPLLAAATFTGYAVYAAVLVRFRPGAPCGCGTAQRPVSVWAVARAAMLAGVAAIATGGGAWTHLDTAQAAAVAVIALTSALALWILPDALHVPGWRGGADKYAELR